MSGKYYWINERENPQLGTYYVLCGRITAKAAKKMETPIYGNNTMHKYGSESAYQDAIYALKARGERIR